MSLQRSLEPREVLPYSDSEIRELYLESHTKTAEQEALAEAAHSWAAIIDACVVCFLLYALVAASIAGLAGMATGLWASALVFAAGAAIVARYNGRALFGPLSLLRYRKELRKARERRRNIDPYDLEVLQAVVEHIAEAPLEQASQIVHSVDTMRSRIEESLKELPEIASALQCEIDGSTDDGMRTLLAAKHDAALDASVRLMLLDAELARQADQAMDAVAPIRELREKFDRVQRLSGSLARIQAAHGLASDARQSVEDHHVQLRLLRATALAASARLREIQSIVEANEQAQSEIASL